MLYLYCPYKNEEVIAYTSRAHRSEREQPDMTSLAAYKGGEGVRYWSNVLLFPMEAAFPTQVLQRNRVCLVQNFINTRNFMSRGCAICAPLS